MFGRGQRPEPDAIEVIIGPRASFNGYLRCDASIRIDGFVEGGQIETPANVILTENARAQCDIVAKTVSIRGIYKGNLRADRVELLEGSQIYGALNVNSFYMDEGVLMHAELNIQGMLPGEKQLPPQRTERQGNIPILPPQLRSPKSA
ncbi:MAG: polymer-forming cytoskeletal protein [Caldilineaceae bacterium]|nr:polymer-forming cytoskeletal protein [Caldilineaceae bacterium]MCB0123471.1 polymer-forming cytoskeletal protein [Caldilineaceae bacterium]HRW05280.1 polymer-forming cytoskeletal protein [Caldilineaceae bacterium]